MHLIPTKWGERKNNFIALIQMNEKATFTQSNMGLLFHEWFTHEISYDENNTSNV